MATLGYCMLCEKLTPIRPGSQKWGTRECAWFPIEHDTPDGKRCGGTAKEIK